MSVACFARGARSGRPAARLTAGLAAALALLLPPLPAHAQPAPAVTYAGRVLNQGAAPLAGAVVLVKGTTLATSTNADGQFLLTVPAGPQVLTVSYPRHLTVQLPISRPDSVLVITLRSTQPRVTPPPRHRPR